MVTHQRLRWSDVFIRRAANVYRVRRRYDEDVLDWRPIEAAAAAVVTQQSMMAGDTTVWVFLDGGVAIVNQDWPGLAGAAAGSVLRTSTTGDAIQERVQEHGLA